MCVEIDSLCVILNIMQVNETVELRQLAEFAAELKKLENEVYVDISGASVFAVIEEYQEVLTLTGNTIAWTDKDSAGLLTDRAFLDNTINRHFKPEIVSHLHACADMTAQAM